MKIALAQLNSGRDLSANLATCRDLAEQAASQGTHWLLFPENAAFLGHDRDKLAVAEPLDGDIIWEFRRLALQHGLWLTVGSFPERAPSPDHTFNTQVLISPSGAIASVYRKIHLFDVHLSHDHAFQESATILAGEHLTVADIPLPHDDREPSANIRVGQTICYDLRFPELYRRLVAAGALVLTVPSAFTFRTGCEHWHTLLRARAIENQAYVLAPNQWGNHGPKRASFGHSVIYDPWGRQLACAPDRVGLITAQLDFDYLQDVRLRLPCLDHRRDVLDVVHGDYEG